MSVIRGLILGKFLPPHQGHEYLIAQACQRVDELYIVVDNIADEIIPVSRRIEWMRQICPQATVLTLRQELPQSPEEAPEDFWNLWEAELKAILPHPIDTVFASEEYGTTLASVLGARFHMVDLERRAVPVSASRIRQNPYQNWDYISSVAKPFFSRKVCIFGPESVGKSTLTRTLAEHYGAHFVPEYARTHIEQNHGRLEYADMEAIALGQHRAVLEACNRAEPILFFDTDALTTKIWSMELYDKYPPLLDSLISEVEYDLYLLLNVDVPWVQDIVRFRPEEREQFFETCRGELEKYGKNYVILSGNWQERLQQAVTVVDRLLA